MRVCIPPPHLPPPRRLSHTGTRDVQFHAFLQSSDVREPKKRVDAETGRGMSVEERAGDKTGMTVENPRFKTETKKNDFWLPP